MSVTRWLAAWALTLACSVTAHAAERPLWELGAGGGLISLPHYRGAESNRVLPVPFVYPIYRGDILKVDEQGVRGLFFKSERARFDVSADGTFPSSGDDVEVREGMPELDATFQIGPSLRIDLWKRGIHAQKLVLTLPVRGVFTVDSSLDYIGLAASPKVTYMRGLTFADRYWRLGVTGGVELGSDNLHDYFYTVAPRFATPDRPSFDADAGYAGTRFTLSIQGRRESNWIGAFVRYDNVRGAVFKDSPLVRRHDNLSAGIVFAWFISRSKRTVEVPDDEVLRY